MLILCYVNHWCDFKFKCIGTWLSDWLIHMMLRNYENESIFLWTFANKYELTTNKSLWFSLIYARIDRLCRRLYTVIQDAVWATFFRENNQECSWGDVCYSVISSHTHTHTDAIRLLSFSISPNQIIGCCCTPDDWIWYSGFFIFIFILFSPLACRVCVYEPHSVVPLYNASVCTTS